MRVVREKADIDEMQFGFVSTRDTTDAIFIIRPLLKKFLGKKKHLYFVFLLEKALTG